MRRCMAQKDRVMGQIQGEDATMIVEKLMFIIAMI